MGEVDVYDIQSNSWSTMPGPFPGTGSVPLGDLGAFVIGTTVYAVGGYDEQYNAVNTTYKLGESWTAVRLAPADTSHHRISMQTYNAL